jgi:hypothetical protein
MGHSTMRKLLAAGFSAGILLVGAMAGTAAHAAAAADSGSFSVGHGTATATGTWEKIPASPPFVNEGIRVTGRLTVNGGCYQVHFRIPSQSPDVGDRSIFLCGRGSMGVRFSGSGFGNLPVGPREIRICRFVSGNEISRDCGPGQIINGPGKATSGTPATGTETTAAPRNAPAAESGTYQVSHAGNSSSGTWRWVNFFGWLVSLDGELNVTSGCAYLNAVPGDGGPTGETNFVQCGRGTLEIYDGASGGFFNARNPISVRLCSMPDGGMPDGRDCGTRQRVG